MIILMLAAANIKKRKSASISLFLLVILATLMLNTGISIFSRLNNFVYDKTLELNGAHFVANLPNDEKLQKQIDFITKYKYIDKTEKEDSIFLNGAVTPFGKGEITLMTVILNADTNRTISPLRLVEKLETDTSDTIFLPYVFKAGGGYSLGDNISLTLTDKKYTYKIGGFFEDTTLGSTLRGSVKAFLPDEAFKSLNSMSSVDMKCTFVAAQLTDMSKVSDLSNDLERTFLSGIFNSTITVDVINSEFNYTMPIKVIASLLIAFAIIILLVSLIVVKFRVSNSIEDDMGNIGSLKSIGYTSPQILLSIIVQFLLISFMAGVLGLAVSYALMPTLGGIISASVGLLWTSQLDIAINTLSLAVVLVLVLVVTLASASKVRKITPIAALRGGIQTHNFKRNHIPLEKTGLNLQFLLGLKTMANTMKQNVFIMLIIASLCFASIFCSIVYYNFSIDKTSLFNIVGAERCNVLIYANPGVNNSAMFEDISYMDGVEKSGMLSQQAAAINNAAVIMYVSDDYNNVEWDNIYEGRQPKYNNEIALSGMIAKAVNKGIGDTIEVSFNENSKKFLITGLSQQFSNAGHVAAVTLEGYNSINPDYKRDELSIYLKEKNTREFIEKVKAKYSKQLFTIGDMDAAAESQMRAIINALFSVMVLIIIMSAIVISLILYLLIKTIILKRKREFGIYKATGYTTFQLMSQISFSFLPIVTAGTLIGGVIGFIFSNRTLSLFLSGLGIYNANFTVDLTSVILICVGMVVTAFIVSMLVSRRVRKISAYSLITE